MDNVTVVVAQYALFAVAAAAVVVWLMASRSDKVSLAIEAVVAMVLPTLETRHRAAQ